MLVGRQVLVDGPAVGDEAQAQLEVAGQAAVRRQRQDQQRGDQEEAHHQQGHAAPVVQQVRAVGDGPVGPDLRREPGSPGQRHATINRPDPESSGSEGRVGGECGRGRDSRAVSVLSPQEGEGRDQGGGGFQDLELSGLFIGFQGVLEEEGV